MNEPGVLDRGIVVCSGKAGVGVVDNVEGFVEDLGFDRFRFDGGALLRPLVVGGLITSVAASVMAAVLATMFNLLSDLTGGLETVLMPKRARRRHLRRRGLRRRSSRADESVSPPEPAAVVAPPRPGWRCGEATAPRCSTSPRVPPGSTCRTSSTGSNSSSTSSSSRPR